MLASTTTTSGEMHKFCSDPQIVADVLNLTLSLSPLAVRQWPSWSLSQVVSTSVSWLGRGMPDFHGLPQPPSRPAFLCCLIDPFPRIQQVCKCSIEEGYYLHSSSLKFWQSTPSEFHRIPQKVKHPIKQPTVTNHIASRRTRFIAGQCMFDSEKDGVQRKTDGIFVLGNIWMQ